MSTELTKPDDYLTLKIGKEKTERELFMSAALIRSLVAVVGEDNDLMSIFTDAGAQNQLMSFVLCPRDNKGRMVDEFYLESVPMSTEEGKKLCDWIRDHILYFFIDNAETAKQKLQGPVMERLLGLLTGSANLMEEKPSAGPSTADQAST